MLRREQGEFDEGNGNAHTAPPQHTQEWSVTLFIIASGRGRWACERARGGVKNSALGMFAGAILALQEQPISAQRKRRPPVCVDCQQTLLSRLGLLT